jgi:hypothetical protein
MKIRVLKAPGGPGMEAERISCLLRKKTILVGRANQPYPVLEIKGGTPEDIQTLLDNEYELLIRRKKTVWENPKFS